VRPALALPPDREPVDADSAYQDERRHFAFYRAQARLRLQRSAAARRLTRWTLEHIWTPVGTGVRPRGETDFGVAYLLTDATREAASRMGLNFGL
jgi:hypothetical protein